MKDAICPACGKEFDPLWRYDRMTHELVRQGMFNADQVDSMSEAKCPDCGKEVIGYDD